MRWAHLPAAVSEPHSETAYTTDGRWTSSTNAARSRGACTSRTSSRTGRTSRLRRTTPSIRRPTFLLRCVAPQERQSPHPVLEGFQSQPASRNFSDDSRRRHVVPAYMGLVKQLDDHLGVLFDFMTRRKRWDDTLVVFCSDHGDYLGDHWLGEKELFHDTVVAVPLIVVRSGRGGTTRRGGRPPRRSIDLLPTFIEALGGTLARASARGPFAAAAAASGRLARWLARVRHQRRRLCISLLRARAHAPADRRLPDVHAANLGVEVHPP